MRLDMKKKRHFFDPHVGIKGATIPLPSPVKEAVRELAGTDRSLTNALVLLRRACLFVGAVVYVHKRALLVRMSNHVWRAIRFR